MSKKYKKVKNYYNSSLWTIEMVKQAVIKNWITAEEFETITGQPYSD